MAVRKNTANMLLESAVRTIPVSSSPLRRKSVIFQNTVSSTLSENDDEAERLARRNEISDVSTPTRSINSSNDKRRSLGLGFLVNMPVSKMAERIAECIKLNTENKINLKNAFSLEMIDFMTYMIKKKDVNMTNLQVASTSLEVSTKIYGFRVDSIHIDILKMSGGLNKQDKDDESQNNVEEMDWQEGIEDNQNKEQKKKKKDKKNKQRIITTGKSLKTNVEIEKPSLITMEADLQTTDMLYQVMLPIHTNQKFYLHPYNDILVDTVNRKNTQEEDTVCIPEIGDLSHLEICSPLFYFDFHSWNADDEPEKTEQNNESRFQFDLDASVPHDNEHVFTSANYFDTELTEEENLDRCAIIPNQVENIVDFCNILTNTVPSKVSEYSFIEKNLNIHWAGPSHWKVTNFRKILSNSRAKDDVHCHPQAKKKKVMELRYDDETIKRVNAKFAPSRAVKLHARTVKIEWNEEILTLPPDEHYDILQANKLYLHTTTLKYDTNATSSSINMENNNDTNDNDMSDYCSNAQNEEYKESEDIDNGMKSDDEGTLRSQMPFTGDNLVAVPKLTNKLSIAYSIRAKKIDMRQLKQSIWNCLTDKGNDSIQEKTEKATNQAADNKMNDTKYFSDVYKELPRFLTKNNIEALSVPISFVSLLHLVNEKTLKISSSSDMADLIIEQD